jgi:ribosomal protein S18 acetylase RimI-like enzyme
MSTRADQDGTKVRRATEKDLQPMIELWKGLMDFHASRDPIFIRRPDGEQNWEVFVRTNMAADNAAVFVAEQESRVVGYCMAMISTYPPVLAVSSYGELMDLMVHPECRRHGIGERLFGAARAWYKERGIKRIEVRVAATNEISTAFWPKMGFQPYLKTLAMEML